MKLSMLIAQCIQINSLGYYWWYNKLYDFKNSTGALGYTLAFSFGQNSDNDCVKANIHVYGSQALHSTRVP